MKRKGILLIAVIVLSAIGFAQAQEGQLSGTVDVTYMSRFIWRGFDYYGDDHSAFQTSIDVDLFGTGFGTSVLWRRAISAPFENAENLNVSVYYGGSLFEDEDFITNYKTGWVYYGFPDEPRSGTATGQAADMQEVFATFSWPNICPAGIVPSYTVLSMWPSEGKSANRSNSGWAHIFGLGYDLLLSALIPDAPDQTLHLSAAAVYNDGTAPGVVIGSASGTIDHDWSHAVFGVSTSIDVGNNLTFTPGFYYQSSWEDTVNTSDEYWTSLSLSYKF